MATANKKSSTSLDISTDTDDSDCAKDCSDSTAKDVSSAKHRGYVLKSESSIAKETCVRRAKRPNHKIKPCLVNKASTSDEELQSNDANQLSTSLGRSSEQPTHGILKVPSGKTCLSC